MLPAHIAGERHHGRGTEQADIDSRRGELRASPRHSQIAARDELTARRRRRAAYRRDDRLGATHDCLHDAGAEAHKHLEEGATAIRIASPGRHFAHIVPSAKGWRRGGDDDGGNPLGCGDILHGREERVQHRLRQAVPALGTIQRKERDPSAIFP